MSTRGTLAPFCVGLSLIAVLVSYGCSGDTTSTLSQSNFSVTFAGITPLSQQGHSFIWASFKVTNTGSVVFTRHTLQITATETGELLYGGETGITADGFFPLSEKLGPAMKIQLRPGESAYISVVLDTDGVQKPTPAEAAISLANPAVPGSGIEHDVKFNIMPTTQKTSPGS